MIDNFYVECIDTVTQCSAVQPQTPNYFITINIKTESIDIIGIYQIIPTTVLSKKFRWPDLKVKIRRGFRFIEFSDYPGKKVNKYFELKRVE